MIAQIGSCRKIVASSLHGIILADASGVPRRIEMTAQFMREAWDVVGPESSGYEGCGRRDLGSPRIQPNVKLAQVEADIKANG